MACLYDRYEIDNIALNILKEKGYHVDFISDVEVYTATDGVYKFRADSLTALLGLIFVKENCEHVDPNECLEILSFLEIEGLLKFSRPSYTPIYYKQREK